MFDSWKIQNMRLSIFLIGILMYHADALAVSNRSESISDVNYTAGQSNNDYTSAPSYSAGNAIVASKIGPQSSETSATLELAENYSVMASDVISSKTMEVLGPKELSPSQTEIPGSSSPYQQFSSVDYEVQLDHETKITTETDTISFSFSTDLETVRASATKTTPVVSEAEPSSTEGTNTFLSSTISLESQELNVPDGLTKSFQSATVQSESAVQDQHIAPSELSYVSNFPSISEEMTTDFAKDRSFMWTKAQEHTPETHSPTTVLSTPSLPAVSSSFIDEYHTQSIGLADIIQASDFVFTSMSSPIEDIQFSFSVEPRASMNQLFPSLPINVTESTMELETMDPPPEITNESNSTETTTVYSEPVTIRINYTLLEGMTTKATVEINGDMSTSRGNASVPTEIPIIKTTPKGMKNVTLIPLPTTRQGKTVTPRTTVGMKTKDIKNVTRIPTLSTRTTTKTYTKPTEPTKYPLKPDNTPTPRKRYTTERTTSRNEIDNETPWRPPVFISAKIKMTMSELCSELHDFSTIILRVLETKLGEKAYQYTVVVLEELQCMPDMEYGKYRREAEITVNFFLVDPRGKYDMEVTETLADLIQETEIDVSGTSFVEKIVAFKVHGVVNKEEERIGETRSKPPGESNELSGGLIALAVIASIAGVAIFIIIILQLMVCRRRMGMKKMRQVYDGSRPSLECHSIVDSIQLTGITTFSEQGSRPSFAYYNPGLHIGDPNKDFSSNPLDGIGIEEMLEEPETIEDEFLMLPNVMPKLSEVPVGAEDKNRYANVIPFPCTRVPLMKLDGEEHSEYINANFIRGYGGEPESYIATQAPLEDTRGDFWRMVWEQQSRVIIMLTDLDEQGLSKCAEYWPNTNGADKVRIYGDYEIILQRREVTPNWIQSTMILKHLDRNLCREIQHYWLTCWPEHGTPDDPTVVLRFLQHVRPDMEEYQGPAVVHCSPGTGRTGTLLAVDICMRSLEDTETVDVLGTVHMLRQDRAGAVQTQEQYFFIYQALLEYAVRFCNATRSYKSSLASLEMQHH